MAERIQNYINGEWVDSESGKTFQSLNPANGQVLADVAKSTVKDVRRAVDTAKAAQDAWRLTPAPRRGEIMFKAGEILLARKEELARQMTQEMGKVLNETRGDMQEGIDMTYYIAGEGRRLMGETTPSELPNKFMMSVREPLGVVAAITPWNFPLAIPTWKIMPSLIAGNTVVFKPASDTPILAARLVEACIEAGVPAGVLNVVFGPGGEIGGELCTHEDIALVSFTGSTEVGKKITGTASPQLKRVSMEMGGKNAIIVLNDADLELAVEGIVWSAFGTSGQRCTAASRIIVEQGVLEELTERLVARTKSLKLGDGLQSGTDVGPVINRSQLNKIHEYTKIGIEEDKATLLCGGEIATEGALADGCFYKPTLFGGVTPEMRLGQEEIFGPTTAIMPAKDYDDAIRIANSTHYGLSTSIFTPDVNKSFRAMRDIQSGLVYVNAGTIGAEVHLPFGGMKETGNGHREAGTAALDIFTEWKTLYIDYSGTLQKAQMDD